VRPHSRTSCARRAAGSVPFLTPEAASKYPALADYVTPSSLYSELGGKTPHRIMIEQHVMEGINRLQRHIPTNGCQRNQVPLTAADVVCHPNCTAEDASSCLGDQVCENGRCVASAVSELDCAQHLYDVDVLDEGQALFGAQLRGHPHLGVDDAVGGEVLGTFGGDPRDRVRPLHDSDRVREGLEVELETLAIGAAQEPGGEVVDVGGREALVAVLGGQVDDRCGPQTAVEVILWQGHCIVHERFTPEEIRRFRAAYGGKLEVLAHPECPPEVLAEADYVGSTSGMVRHVQERRPPRLLLVTECSMSDNVAVEFPDLEFVRPCQMCPYMKRITLPAILDSLVYLRYEVEVDPAVASRARRAVEAMLAVGRGRGG